MNKREFKERICELIETYRKAGPLFLVFHDSSGDLKSALILPPLKQDIS